MTNSRDSLLLKQFKYLDSPEQVGKRIDKYLVESEMTQRFLAQAIHVTPAYVSRLVNGERTASLQVLMMIAGTLNVSLSDLCGVKYNCPHCGGEY